VAEYLHPGVFVEEKSSGLKPIEAASTSTACFVGTIGRGRPGVPTFVSSWFRFKDAFGDLDKNHDLPLAAYQFFQNGGARAYILRVLAGDATGALDAAGKASAEAIVKALGEGKTEKEAAKAGEAAAMATVAPAAAAIAAAATAEAAAKAAPTDANLAKAAEDALEAAEAAGVLVLIGDDGIQRPAIIKAAGDGVWGNDLKITVTETKADVLAAAAVIAENAKTGGHQVPLPIHFDIAVSLHGQPVEGWTFLDGHEDGDKFYAAIINRFSSYIRIAPGADGEFPQGAIAYLEPAPPPPPAPPPAPLAPAAGGPAAPGVVAPAAGGPASPVVAAPAAGAPAAGAGAPAAPAAGAPAAGAGTPAAPRSALTAAAARLAALPPPPPVPKHLVIKLDGGSDGGTATAPDFENAFLTLDRLSDISLLVVPGVDAATANAAASYVTARAAKPGVGGDLFYIMDPPSGEGWSFGPRDTRDSAAQIAAITKYAQLLPLKTSYSALFFPWVTIADPYSKISGTTRYAPPSGMIAGLFARTDNTRGVWKAPAGTEASMLGAIGVAADVSDQDQDTLNPIGVNCIRQFAASGIVCWGTRTLATLSDPEWRYVPVRRTANFLKTSLYRGTQWVVFEPNDEPLWRAIRFNLTAFMSSLFRAGAFQGSKPEEAFFVKCDKDNNSQATIDQGQVHILVGFAPLKPAEFVIIQLQQIIQQ